MTSPMHAKLDGTSRLPEGWSSLEIFEDTVTLPGVVLRRAGIASVGPTGEEATGAGAAVVEAPVRRSYFELLERVATLEALEQRKPRYELLTESGKAVGTLERAVVFPESSDASRWRYARSNGIALQVDWRAACARAKWELVERDRVLRSWYGESRPARIRFPLASILAPIEGYEWRAYAFPRPDGASFEDGIEVTGVFGFPAFSSTPSSPVRPMVIGFGARTDLASALDAATAEATQVLAFLWGESAPKAEPEPGPTAGHHGDYFQWGSHQSALRRWLDGGHVASATERHPALDSRTTTFVDLTPTWLEGGLRVAKALSPSALPLVFGESPLVGGGARGFGPHPIG